MACRITAGAGGTEAQDWAAMLHRMYRRWAASRGLAHESETGLLVVRGAAGAELLGEHGVHRLARFSPHDPRRRLPDILRGGGGDPAGESTSGEGGGIAAGQ